jgi:hypothetical protein
MKWSSALLAAGLGLASAHAEGGRHVPKLVGARKFLSEMKMKRHLDSESPVARAAAVAEPELVVEGPANLEKRQNTDGQCGAGFGSCAAGYCCSPEGYVT